MLFNFFKKKKIIHNHYDEEELDNFERPEPDIDSDQLITLKEINEITLDFYQRNFYYSSYETGFKYRYVDPAISDHELYYEKINKLNNCNFENKIQLSEEIINDIEIESILDYLSELSYRQFSPDELEDSNYEDENANNLFLSQTIDKSKDVYDYYAYNNTTLIEENSNENNLIDINYDLIPKRLSIKKFFSRSKNFLIWFFFAILHFFGIRLMWLWMWDYERRTDKEKPN